MFFPSICRKINRIIDIKSQCQHPPLTVTGDGFCIWTGLLGWLVTWRAPARRSHLSQSIIHLYPIRVVYDVLRSTLSQTRENMERSSCKKSVWVTVVLLWQNAMTKALYGSKGLFVLWFSKNKSLSWQPAAGMAVGAEAESSHLDLQAWSRETEWAHEDLNEA